MIGGGQSQLVNFFCSDGEPWAANWYEGDSIDDLAKSRPGIVRIETPEGEQLWPAPQPEPEKPRFCVDCEFHKTEFFYNWATQKTAKEPTHLCDVHAFLEPEISLVTGEPKPIPKRKGCEGFREPDGICGPEGVLWRAKESECSSG